jgi:hypothetical protein
MTALTANEASEKLCPLKFAIPGGRGTCERASCMMWRWVLNFERNESMSEYVGMHVLQIKPTHGYCGMAGVDS